MRKIKSSVCEKDRVVCTAQPGELAFYYQAFGTGERIVLFVGTKDKAIPFSESVFLYFRKNGRCFDGRSGFSLTIKELYSVDKRHYRNPKLAKLFDRLPGAIDLAIREQNLKNEQVRNNSDGNHTTKTVYEDRTLAA